MRLREWLEAQGESERLEIVLIAETADGVGGRAVAAEEAVAGDVDRAVAVDAVAMAAVMVDRGTKN